MLLIFGKLIMEINLYNKLYNLIMKFLKNKKFI